MIVTRVVTWTLNGTPNRGPGESVPGLSLDERVPGSPFEWVQSVGPSDSEGLPERLETGCCLGFPWVRVEGGEGDVSPLLEYNSG